MGRQYNKHEKRARHNRYLARLKVREQEQIALRGKKKKAAKAAE